jgi:two-component system response regulator DesR
MLIAESVPLLREGLLALLAKEPGIEVVAEIARRELVLPAVCRLRPDVAVIDGDIAAHDGFAVIRELHARVPACGLVIMSSSRDPCELREAMAACPDGLVIRDSDPDMIIEAIRQVAAGKKALDPDLVFSALNSAALKSAASPLTAREIDVLRLAAQGAPDTEIADRLYLSVGTVRNYMSRVIGKVGARNRVDAVRIAGAAGWLWPGS